MPGPGARQRRPADVQSAPGAATPGALPYRCGHRTGASGRSDAAPLLLKPRLDLRPAEPPVAADADMRYPLCPRGLVDPRRQDAEPRRELRSRQQPGPVGGRTSETGRCTRWLRAHTRKERKALATAIGFRCVPQTAPVAHHVMASHGSRRRRPYPAQSCRLRSANGSSAYSERAGHLSAVASTRSR